MWNLMGLIKSFIVISGASVGACFMTTDIPQEYINELVRDLKTTHKSPYVEQLSLSSKYAEIAYLAPIRMKDMNKWQDYQWLAKLLYTERVTPHDLDELRFIAATALHRSLMDDRPLKKVCQDKKAYSGVMRPSNKNWLDEPKPAHKQIAYEMIELYKKGIPDDFKGAYAFCNVAWVEKNNPSAMTWFNTMKRIGTFTVPGHGTHTFFKNKYWDKWQDENPKATLNEIHLS